MVLAVSGVLASVPPAGAADGTGAGAAGAADGAQFPQIPTVLDRPDGTGDSGGTGGTCVKPSRSVSTRTPWQQTTLALSESWQFASGAGVKVAVVDTGVDASGVPALRGRVTAGPDVVSGGRAGTDCVGHGTFAAGLIAAAPRSGTGFAGVAPGATIVAVRVTDRYGATTADRVADGITAAVSAGAGVVDVPIALGTTSPALTRAVASAVKKGALVVAPAYAAATDGTGSGQAGSPTAAPLPAAYPAALPGVLAVAAIGPGGAAELTVAPVTRPGLAAPGTSVLSVGPGGSGGFTGSGAAFASALVAGVAALVVEREPGLTPAQLTARLERTAYHAAADGQDPLVGWGTVQPVRAVSEVLPAGAPAESAAGAVRPPLRVPAPAARTAVHQAWVVAAGAALLIALTALAAVALPRARRRRAGTRA